MTDRHGDPRMTTVLCTYRVKPGKLAKMLELVSLHWSALDSLGLVAGEPSRVYHGLDGSGGDVIHEIFTWKDAGSPGIAHAAPEVKAIWGPMIELCEERGGRPAMEFTHARPLAGTRFAT
jgi:hypothetical protein